MKVRELIQALKILDPNAEVEIVMVDPDSNCQLVHPLHQVSDNLTKQVDPCRWCKRHHEARTVVELRDEESAE